MRLRVFVLVLLALVLISGQRPHSFVNKRSELDGPSNFMDTQEATGEAPWSYVNNFDASSVDCTGEYGTPAATSIVSTGGAELNCDYAATSTTAPHSFSVLSATVNRNAKFVGGLDATQSSRVYIQFNLYHGGGTTNSTPHQLLALGEGSAAPRAPFWQIENAGSGNDKMAVGCTASTSGVVVFPRTTWLIVQIDASMKSGGTTYLRVYNNATKAQIGTTQSCTNDSNVTGVNAVHVGRWTGPSASYSFLLDTLVVQNTPLPPIS